MRNEFDPVRAFILLIIILFLMGLFGAAIQIANQLDNQMFFTH